MADYYVSPTGNDNNPGTKQQPWKTIAKANQVLQPGDAVYLRQGTYSGDPIRPTRNGTSAARIRYLAYPTETPTLTNTSEAINLKNRSYISVNGIHVDGGQPSPNANVDHFVTILNGVGNVIRNCYFRCATGYHGVRLTGDSHHNTIADNVVDIVGIYDNGDGQDWGDAVQITKDAHHNLIEGNVVTRGAHNCLQVQGSYNVIRRNLFDNDWSNILGYGKGGRCVALMGRYNVFEENVVRNAGASTDKPRNAGMKVEGRDNIVRRNFIYDNSNEGITTQSRNKQPYAQRNHIFHNTLHNNGGPAWSLIWYNGGQAVQGNIFKNNIVAESRGALEDDGDIDFRLQNNPSGDPLGGVLFERNLISSAAATTQVDIKSVGVRTIAQAEAQYPNNFKNNIVDVPTFVSALPFEPEDYALAPYSRGVDEGAPLTKTASSGSGKTIALEDAGYFTDGFSLVEGDLVRIGTRPATRITDISYANNTITVEDSLTWSAGESVNLNFVGTAPDIGAVEGAGQSQEPEDPEEPEEPEEPQEPEDPSIVITGATVVLRGTFTGVIPGYGYVENAPITFEVEDV